MYTYVRMLLKVSIKKELLQILYRNIDYTSQPMNRMYSCIKLYVLYIVGSQRLLSFIKHCVSTSLWRSNDCTMSIHSMNFNFFFASTVSAIFLWFPSVHFIKMWFPAEFPADRVRIWISIRCFSIFPLRKRLFPAQFSSKSVGFHATMPTNPFFGAVFRWVLDSYPVLFLNTRFPLAQFMWDCDWN